MKLKIEPQEGRPSLLKEGTEPPAPDQTHQLGLAPPPERPAGLWSEEKAKKTLAYLFKAVDDEWGEDGDLRATAFELELAAPIAAACLNSLIPGIAPGMAPGEDVPPRQAIAVLVVMLAVMGALRWRRIDRRRRERKLRGGVNPGRTAESHQEAPNEGGRYDSTSPPAPPSTRDASPPPPGGSIQGGAPAARTRRSWELHGGSVGSGRLER